MKTHVLSILFAVLMPFAGQAAETTFFSQEGKYALPSGTTLTISQDELGHQDVRVVLAFAGGGDSAETLNSVKPSDPFLVYWDGTTQTLWWGSTRSFGYLDVQQPGSPVRGVRARTAPAQADHPFRSMPAVFAAELDRRIPAHP